VVESFSRRASHRSKRGRCLVDCERRFDRDQYRYRFVAKCARRESPCAHGLGNGVSSPRLIYSRQPVYTAAAMQARISGRVLLECVVERDGRVGRVRILRSLDAVHGLDERPSIGLGRDRGVGDGPYVVNPVSSAPITMSRTSRAANARNRSTKSWFIGELAAGAPLLLAQFPDLQHSNIDRQPRPVRGVVRDRAPRANGRHERAWAAAVTRPIHDVVIAGSAVTRRRPATPPRARA
jgi:hypothetical protein